MLMMWNKNVSGLFQLSYNSFIISKISPTEFLCTREFKKTRFFFFRWMDHLGHECNNISCKNTCVHAFQSQGLHLVNPKSSFLTPRVFFKENYFFPRWHRLFVKLSLNLLTVNTDWAQLGKTRSDWASSVGKLKSYS